MKRLSKKKKTIIFLIICLVLIAAVIIVINFVGGKKDFKTVSLEKAVEEAQDYSFSEHDNLVFDCKADSFTADKIYEITMSSEETPAGEEEKQKLRQLIKDFTGFELDMNDIRTDLEDRENYAVYSREDSGSDEPVWGEFSSRLTFGVSDEEESSRLYSGGTGMSSDISLKETINVLGGEDYDTATFTVDDKQVSVAETVESCLDCIENCKLESYMNEGEKLVLSDIAICYNATTENEFLVVHFVHEYEGLLVNDSGHISEDEFLRPSFLDFYCNGPDAIARIDNRYYYKIDSVKEIKGKVMPLSEAEELLSQKLAPNKVYHVTEVGLKYACITDNSEWIYRPMWCFTLEEYGYDGAHYFTDLTACVDIDSGEIHIYDSRQKLMY